MTSPEHSTPTPQSLEQEILALRRRVAELEARQSGINADAMVLLQAAIDTMTAHVAILSDTGVVVMVNDAWRQFADRNGLPVGANYCQGTNYLDVCDRATGPFAEDAALVAEGIRSVIAGRDSAFHHQYACPSKTEIRWFTMQVCPMSGVTPPLVAAINVDITARERMHLALNQNRLMLHNLLGNLPGMAYRCQNDSRWTMLFVSEGCFDLTGYDPTDLVLNRTVSYSDLIHPDDRQHVRNAVLAAVQRDRPFQVTYRIMPRSGDEKWVWEQGRAVTLPDGTGVLDGLVTDFTPQKRAQLDLQTSEQKIRSLINQSSDGILLSNADGQVIEWNPALERITGRTRDEALGSFLWELRFFMDAPDAPHYLTPNELKTTVEYILKTDDAHVVAFDTVENEIVRPDGEQRTLQSSPFPIRTGQDLLIGAIVRDITEQQAAANALRESEARWRSLVEYAPDIIFMLSRDGTILFVNHTAPGYNTEESIGRVVFEFVPTIYHADLRQTLTQVFDDALPSYMELEAPVGPHELGWYSGHMSPIKREGEVVAAIFMAHDITARRQHESEMVASETRFRSLFDEVPVALWEEDFSLVKAEIERLRAEGITDFEKHLIQHPDEVARLMGLVRILNVNQATLMLWGTPSKAQASETLKSSPSPEVLPVLRDQLLAIANGQASFSGEGVGLRSDGTTLPIMLKWAALSGHEKDLGRVIVSMEDITARQEAEAERLRTAIEHEKVTILADFVQNASHEFRTPLSVIFTGLELLERGAHLSENWQQRLSAMKSQTEYLGALVDAMLAMAQLDRTTEINGMMLDLNPIVRDVASEAVRPPNERKIMLSLNLPENLPRIYGDASALRRALLNIVRNAVQFSHMGGLVSIDVAPLGPGISVSITDRGNGIPPEHLPYIFDRFYRADRARRTRYAGLGLSISRKIVELHGGHIDVTSTLGQGSTFTVWLPLPD